MGLPAELDAGYKGCEIEAAAVYRQFGESNT
jgi:hypothetical protein